MNSDRLFLDTAFIQALLNPRDTYHPQALALFPRVRNADEVWITEAILIEVGNACSAYNRQGAVAFIQQCYQTRNLRIVSVDTQLLRQAVNLYQSWSDKTWGLTDGISLVVMGTYNLSNALTTDRHFRQAGFQALMLDE